MACSDLSTSGPPGQDVDDDGAAGGADVVRESAHGAVHLAAAGLAEQLLVDLDDLPRSRRADGVALGLESAGRVDHALAAELGVAVGRCLGACAFLEQAKV